MNGVIISYGDIDNKLDTIRNTMIENLNIKGLTVAEDKTISQLVDEILKLKYNKYPDWYTEKNKGEV